MKRNGLYILVATSTFAAITFFLIKHLNDIGISRTNYAISYSVMFGYLALTTFASLAARPHVPVEGFDYDALEVDVFVPTYNEDPALLSAGLLSLTNQSRPVSTIWIVDDGSCDEILDDPKVIAAVERAQSVGVCVRTHRQFNLGKRVAQAWGFTRSDADVYVTVDSDTVLREDAIEKLLLPFGHEDVKCVGGLAVGQNHKASLLTRIVELGFVMAFLSGRMAEGFFGAVRVNCGILAAYRGEIVRSNLDRYLTQTFMGHPVKIGDDRALTIYCKEEGRAEFQVDAVAYSALPISVSHLVRQRARWARSWYWGTLWLLRRPLRSPDFVMTMLQVLAMVAYLITIVTGLVGIGLGDIKPRFLGFTILTSITLGMVTTFRYVAWGRPDEPIHSRLLTWLLSPLSSLLYMFLLVPLYWYAAFSLRPKGWGTRSKVEVGLHHAGLEMVDAA